MTDEQVQEARNGKPPTGVVKKRRHTEIETPETPDIKVQTRPMNSVSDTSRLEVADIRASVEETTDRVLHEIYPGMAESPYVRMVTDEEAYVIVLGMLYGEREDNPRHGLKFREHDFGERPLCKEHRS